MEKQRNTLLEAAEALDAHERLDNAYIKEIDHALRTADYYRNKYTEYLQKYTDLLRKFEKVEAKNKRRRKALKEINHGLRAAQLENLKLKQNVTSAYAEEDFLRRQMSFFEPKPNESAEL